MRMILYGCLLTIALVLHPFVAAGDQQSQRKAAETLLMVMEVDKSLPKLVDQMVENQIQQNPQLAAQREVFQQFFKKYLNWETVKDDTITAYTQEFTEQELKKLTEFYKTPLGKKTSEKMPKLAFISGQIGLKQAQAHQMELRQMLEERAKQ
jgi:hypothetical protein